MSDIIYELRSDVYDEDHNISLCHAAADEIEKLRMEINSLTLLLPVEDMSYEENKFQMEENKKSVK